MTLMQVGLDDKYRLEAKRIYLSGCIALVRLPMLQRECDRIAASTPQASSRATAARRSGCMTTRCGAQNRSCRRRTSPSFRAERRFGCDRGVGQPAGRTVSRRQSRWCVRDLVRQGPGVDRSVDVLKHANSAGASRNGGVLALAGDDHGCQSSTLAHQSEQVFAAALMPIINPRRCRIISTSGYWVLRCRATSGCWGRVHGDR